MDGIRFRIRYPDGKAHELFTETPRVLIGSGSHCEIRLPIGEARVEHVVIQSTPAGWRAVARSLDPVPKLDGVEFTEVPVGGECVIAIGQIRIDVAPFATAGGDQAVRRDKARQNPRIYLYLALGVACSLTLLAAGARPKASATEPNGVPELWPSSIAQKCPQTTAEPALALANTRFDLAIAKRERSPFHPEDGVSGVSLYETAEACFRVAGRDADAEEAAASAQRMRGEMIDRFRDHRLRLQRALATEQWGAAERESGILLSFFSSGPNEYVTWLANLRRRLQLRYGSKGKKES
jgi:hypothetical protein